MNDDKQMGLTDTERLSFRMSCLQEARSFPDSVNVRQTLKNAEKLEKWLETGIIPPEAEKA